MTRMRIEMEILAPFVANLALPLEALTSMNARYLRERGASVPWLYNAGVRYIPEGRNGCTGRPDERWEPIPRVIELGGGDCEDLACWRAAELRVRGLAPRDPRRFPRARAFAVRSGQTVIAGIGRVNLIHILVSRDGTCSLAPNNIEDPSVRLGMKPWSAAQLRSAVLMHCRV